MEQKEIFKKLFELGVSSGLHADFLYKRNVINDSERRVAWNLRMPSSFYSSDMSMNPDPPLLYPKWCYDELNFGGNRINYK